LRVVADAPSSSILISRELELLLSSVVVRSIVRFCTLNNRGCAVICRVVLNEVDTGDNSDDDKGTDDEVKTAMVVIIDICSHD
jgi:hypothetical protein